MLSDCGVRYKPDDCPGFIYTAAAAAAARSDGVVPPALTDLVIKELWTSEFEHVRSDLSDMGVGPRTPAEDEGEHPEPEVQREGEEEEEERVGSKEAKTWAGA
jgi:hypothetical protein